MILTIYTFINFRDINIYEATVIDRMHHLDLELFNYQITYTFNLLKDLYRASILDIIDNRLANIPRYPELRNLMKVIIFVLDNLNISESLNKKLLKLYEDWNNMYIISRYEKFSDKDLNDFEVC